MVKLQVSEGFKQPPAMPDTRLYLQQVEFLDAETTDKGIYYDARLKFSFEILEVEDPDHDEWVGEVFPVYGNMPKGKSGKLATNSNLFEILEGLSGGSFDPGDEIDTDIYEGKEYIGDFKREVKKVKTDSGWIPDPDGAKTTKLRHLRPVRPKRQRAQREEPVQNKVWDEDDED